MVGPLPVAVMGLGFIGRKIAEAALASPELTLVAAVDRAPELAGRPLAELVKGAPASVKVDKDLAPVLERLKGGVLLHATGSRFLDVLPQLEAAARSGVHVVSTCEELAFPWLRFEKEADALDELARSNDISLLGTGVNPGFVLDRLVAAAGSVCGLVRHAHAERVVDLATRRQALRDKAGVGLSEDEFDRREAKGGLGHVGLPESAALCALGLGLDFEEYEEEVEPIFAEEDFAPLGLVKGQVAGIFQRVRGFEASREIVSLELLLQVGADTPHDLIRLAADPPVELTVTPGYAGESATAWAAVNAAPRLTAAEAGLLTVLELPAGR